MRLDFVYKALVSSLIQRTDADSLIHKANTVLEKLVSWGGRVSNQQFVTSLNVSSALGKKETLYGTQQS